MRRTDIRNVAIIAHVDHGKTTLVDQMLRQSGLFRDAELQGERILDSNDQERERGITILAKNIAFKIGDTKVNLLDTPGHADFGGEVERVLKMADGCFLLVDAAEGPMPQTRFVLRKAFEAGLRPIVVVNKIDRPDARIDHVNNLVFELFIDLGHEDYAMDYPTVYASGRDGIATHDLSVEPKDLKPLYQAILDHVPAPEVDTESPLQMQIVTLSFSDFVGRIGVGRVARGKIRKQQKVAMIKRDGTVVNTSVNQLFVFDRLARVEAEEVTAGDICAVVGLGGVDIGDTIADAETPEAMPAITIDEPTLDMVFRVNDSPFCGQEGNPLTSRQLRDRLMKELESNVAMRVRPNPDDGGEFIVSGRGMLHLSVLIETMRREGAEIAVGKPRVITKEIDGQKMEPVELLVVDAPIDSSSSVIELVQVRKGEILTMEPGEKLMHMEFLIPARGLIGLRTRVLTKTGGEAIMHHSFHEYQPVKGEIPSRQNGVMISTEFGKATAYKIEQLQERGILFVQPMESVYEGQVVGEHARDNDLTVNITQEKKLTNMRSAGADKNTPLKAPRLHKLEEALEYVEDDELVEITPNSIRMRKMMLKESDRKRASRQGGK